MPENRTIQILIDGQEAEITSAEEFPIAISYKLEDRDDFQKKKSSEALSVVLPATKANDKIGNTFHAPGVEDLSTGELYRSARSASIIAAGQELLTGKAFLKSVTHNSRPLEYEYDFYGGNGDWMVDLKEITLFDLLQHITFTYSKAVMEASWAYDGTSEALPYVFAPVRYGNQMADSDTNMKPEYMKPSISKYWIIYWAFKSLGYKVSSQFFDTAYFRRQVMPWTWGNFLFSDGTKLDNLRFMAKSSHDFFLNSNFTGFWDFAVDNDSTVGGYDNNNVYTYSIPSQTMRWQYVAPFNFGKLSATFHIAVPVQATAVDNSNVELRVQYFKNGTRITSHDDPGNGTTLVNLNAPSVGRQDFYDTAEDWFTIDVNPGDVITVKLYLHTFASGVGRANIRASVETFELAYFRIPLGGTIDFSIYPGLKKWKFLDYLRGVVDEFNLIPITDAVQKVVYFEPAHAYSLTNDLSATSGGFFNNSFLDWTAKQDLSQTSKKENYADSEREVIFKYRDDAADGILKKIQDRNSAILGSGKYVLPERYKTGQDEVENRFFSALMHYEMKQWEHMTGSAAQMPCLIPENVSNTSSDEAQNIFGPKSAYYKGLDTAVGWVWDGVETFSGFPFMFAVNYRDGGENDPVLSYSDEKIKSGTGFVLGKGLLRRFFMQRMANMRGAILYDTFFRLNNNDAARTLHREHIAVSGERWELVEINGYKPLRDEATACTLRKVVPVSVKDDAAIYPTGPQVLDNTLPLTGTFEVRYASLKALPKDI